MNIEDKEYVAIMFKIEECDSLRGIYFYRPYDIIEDCNIDFATGILKMPDGNELLPMESKKLIDEEHEFCYGLPMQVNDLKKKYNKSASYYGLIESYFTDLNNNIYYGVINKDNEELNVVMADKDDLVNHDDYSWFYNYNEIYPYDEFDYGDLEEDEDDYLSLSVGQIDNVIKTLNEGKILKVTNFFKRAKEAVSDINNIDGLFEAAVELDNASIEEEKEVDATSLSTEDNLEKVKPYLKKLNDLVGLEEVKAQVNGLVSLLIFLNKVDGKLDIDKPNLNMFFTGNPGTGKTTVARIIKDILSSLGYTKNNKFTEITTRDLIAGYVGQTAIKTDLVLNENKGGVVFIDEAYAFSSKAQEFGDEALVEIIKAMEKKDTTFIFAGYRDEMEAFINKNPGLASRIGYYIDYRDYTDEELLQMFKNKVEKTRMKLAPDVDSKIISVIKEARSNKHFGNGRFIDKLYEKIIIKHASNTVNIDDMVLVSTITCDDIDDELVDELIYKNKNNHKQQIGFAYQKK